MKVNGKVLLNEYDNPVSENEIQLAGIGDYIYIDYHAQEYGLRKNQLYKIEKYFEETDSFQLNDKNNTIIPKDYCYIPGPEK